MFTSNWSKLRETAGIGKKPGQAQSQAGKEGADSRKPFPAQKVSGGSADSKPKSSGKPAAGAAEAKIDKVSRKMPSHLRSVALPEASSGMAALPTLSDLNAKIIRAADADAAAASAIPLPDLLKPDSLKLLEKKRRRLERQPADRVPAPAVKKEKKKSRLERRNELLESLKERVTARVKGPAAGGAKKEEAPEPLAWRKQEVKHKSGAVTVVNMPPPDEPLAIDCEMVGVGPEGKTRCVLGSSPPATFTPASCTRTLPFAPVVLVSRVQFVLILPLLYHFFSFPPLLRSALARIAVASQDGRLVFHRFVRPVERVVDCRTAVSGIQREMIESDAAMPHFVVLHELGELIRNRVIVGHGLTADLRTLLLSHPRFLIRDTATHKPFCPTHVRKLGAIAKDVLGEEVPEGHQTPMEDAALAMRLYLRSRLAWDKAAEAGAKEQVLAHKQAVAKLVGEWRARQARERAAAAKPGVKRRREEEDSSDDDSGSDGSDSSDSDSDSDSDSSDSDDSSDDE